jgi:hypothetical protein
MLCWLECQTSSTKCCSSYLSHVLDDDLFVWERQCWFNCTNNHQLHHFMCHLTSFAMKTIGTVSKLLDWSCKRMKHSLIHADARALASSVFCQLWRISRWRWSRFPGTN